jgi:hypothetical protein
MKEIWSGFLRAIGAFGATSAIFLLGVWLTPLRKWVADWFGGHATAGRIDLTIYLSVLTIVLLGLLIFYWGSYYSLLRRVRDGKLTFGDFYGMKEMMKATDINEIIRRRLAGEPDPENKYLEVFNKEWKECIEREIKKRKKTRDT